MLRKPQLKNRRADYHVMIEAIGARLGLGAHHLTTRGSRERKEKQVIHYCDEYTADPDGSIKRTETDPEYHGSIAWMFEQLGNGFSAARQKFRKNK